MNADKPLTTEEAMEIAFSQKVEWYPSEITEYWARHNCPCENCIRDFINSMISLNKTTPQRLFEYMMREMSSTEEFDKETELRKYFHKYLY